MWFRKKETQLNRIATKLEKAMRKDTELAVFGASTHNYQVNEKLTAKELADWQATYQIKLPEPYAQFLTEVGDGGAGPFYGLYSLEKATSYTESDALTATCMLYPGMAKEEWNHLIEPLISDEDISDSEYEAARNRVLGGMLCIGTQGCDYDMYLVLEGQHKGRVVYTSDFHPDHPFFFVYEDNILDWYERWLDEVLLDYDIGWFGSRMPGDEPTLLQAYHNATDEVTQSKTLDGLFKIKKLSQPTLQFLKNIADQGQNNRATAIRLICKTSIDEGREYLLELLHSDSEKDVLSALQILNWYGKAADLTEFINVILQRLGSVRDVETLRHVGYVLEPSGAITIRNFAPFLRHADFNIQTAAIYATRNCDDKSEGWEIIERMFADGGKEVVKSTISYWGIVPHERLLPYYKAVWPEYKGNPNFREKFIDGLRKLNMADNYFDQA
ncbi:hypothetical protein PA598K_03464 [Paenibacillus sp. 598K]|uniref:SMI1/KNR4 family protein n=1 Tax=Paenibacillus sp. 598K TaxID=1117987 RepID=UPI000FFA8C87|nr:SMI1/KNR4 family protein [Paenibacillus sp. 598K]GBF75082.1 hypothetical protein PA598K_03464 [Paenibacillus sp. 598K]